MPGFGNNSFLLIFLLLMMTQGNGFGCGDNSILFILLIMMMCGPNFRICDNK